MRTSRRLSNDANLDYTVRMALQFTTSYIEDSLGVFRYYKKLAERAMEQVTDEQLFEVLDCEANSIAIVVKHLAGNMRSRWTDFLTTDGEKPNRNRDSEFADPPTTRAALLAEWEDGWSRLFGAIEPLTDADLGRKITIRGEAHSVMQAINRRWRITHITLDRLCCWRNILPASTGNR